CLRHHTAQDKLVLHADNGDLMKGATTLATLQKLGVVSSFSRPSVNNDNPHSEAAFRTLKCTPAYPKKPFASIEGARQWIAHFVIWYNTNHRHSSIRFVRRSSATKVAARPFFWRLARLLTRPPRNARPAAGMDATHAARRRLASSGSTRTT